MNPLQKNKNKKPPHPKNQRTSLFQASKLHPDAPSRSENAS